MGSCQGQSNESFIAWRNLESYGRVCGQVSVIFAELLASMSPRLFNSGRARAIGVSNHTIEDMEAARVFTVSMHRLTHWCRQFYKAALTRS